MREHMKSERLRAGLTTQEVAARIGVHVNIVQRWERDEAEPMGSNLIKLARLYGCTPEYLLGFTDEREERVPVAN